MWVLALHQLPNLGVSHWGDECPVCLALKASSTAHRRAREMQERDIPRSKGTYKTSHTPSASAEAVMWPGKTTLLILESLPERQKARDSSWGNRHWRHPFGKLILPWGQWCWQVPFLSLPSSVLVGGGHYHWWPPNKAGKWQPVGPGTRPAYQGAHSTQPWHIRRTHTVHTLRAYGPGDQRGEFCQAPWDVSYIRPVLQDWETLTDLLNT